MKVLWVSSLWQTRQNPQYVIFLKQLANALRENNVDVQILVVSQGENEYIGDNVHFIKKDNYKIISELIYKYNFDAVHMHFSLGYRIDGFIQKICQNQRIPFIYHIHGLNVLYDYYIKHPLLSHYSAFKKWIIYKKADAIVGVSNKVCEIVRKSVRRDNVYTVYNGVDTKKFYPEGNNEGERLEIACIGNLIKIKGQEFLIRALKMLKDDGVKNIHLSIFGRGVEEDNLKTLVKDLDLEDIITFKGYVEYEEIEGHLRKTDIFILPSYFEAIGCVYLEAMASKVCTIGCKNQGISEIIKNGENGFLVDERDEISIYKCLKEVILNSEKREDIARAGYETVINKYTWNDSAKKMIDVYNQVIKYKESK